MDTLLAIAGIAATIICGLIAVIYWAGQRRDDKQDERFDRIEEKADDHETRITTLEEGMRTVKHETGILRERWHEVMGHVSQSLASWYTDLVKLIKGDK